MLDVFLWWLAISLFGPLAVLTAAPLILNSGTWVVRAWDFPRLQLSALTILPAVPLLALLARDSEPLAASILLVLLILMACSGLVQMAPFTRLWRREVQDLIDSTEESAMLTILVANICYENEEHRAVADSISRADPDVLLLIELDTKWRDALADLADRFPHRVESIAGEGLGLGLWSKRPLSNESIEHLISERRPSIFADLQMPDGRALRFVGLHPTPPGLQDSTGEDRRDSRVRDGELVLLARDIARGPSRNWIVAGDFNDVAWSHTTRLFQRLSGLKDPRVGRKLMNTFHAKHWYLRFPVDHLFLAPGLRIGRLDRVRLPGSDHFGVLATVALEPAAEAKPPEPEADQSDRAEGSEMVEEGQEDAEARGVRADDGTTAA